jgi:hypothetical protein
MIVEIITKEDLQAFRLELLRDLKELLNGDVKKENSDWLRSSQVRKMLNVSAGTLQNLRISGSLKPSKIGGSFFYKHQEILALLTNNSRKEGRSL